MPTRIPSLRRYQRPRRLARFDDLPPLQRAAAEAHYQRLCARWGADLPQWRRAILVGRAKDLAIRPRDGAWARRLRGQGKTRPAAPTLNALAPPRTDGRLALPLTATEPPIHYSQPPVGSASCSEPLQQASAPAQPSLASTPHAIRRLDIRGITTSGTDGADTAQRILRDPALRTFYQSALSIAGYTVVTAEDGIEALRRLDHGATPALVILDLTLPRLGGRDVLVELKAHADTRRIPIMVVSGTETRDFGPEEVACVLRKPALQIGPAESGPPERRWD